MGSWGRAFSSLPPPAGETVMGKKIGQWLLPMKPAISSLSHVSSNPNFPPAVTAAQSWQDAGGCSSLHGKSPFLQAKHTACHLRDLHKSAIYLGDKQSQLWHLNSTQSKVTNRQKGNVCSFHQMKEKKLKGFKFHSVRSTTLNCSLPCAKAVIYFTRGNTQVYSLMKRCLTLLLLKYNSL